MHPLDVEVREADVGEEVLFRLPERQRPPHRKALTKDGAFEVIAGNLYYFLKAILHHGETHHIMQVLALDGIPRKARLS